MTRSLPRRTLLAACFIALAAACGRNAGSRARTVVRVFAAASLTAPFQAIAAAFERAHAGQVVELHFAGTPQLALQIREGAAADVFAAADQPNMQKVVDAGEVDGAPVEFARNRLAIAVPAANPRRLGRLSDLGRADLKVALCGPDVPAGRYAREALRKAGVTVRSVSDEPSVKALVSKVQLGELDAAIVFVTDATATGVRGLPLDPAHDVVASYPIALLAGAGNRAAGAAFVAFVRGADGRALLAAHGFELP
jgi:molybdate transport system substrate-binding protein